MGCLADKYLSKKQCRDGIESLERRSQKVIEFVSSLRPGLSVTLSVLRDPDEPTPAETNETLNALVVSKETLRGGEAINEWRLQRGLRPLTLVTTGLVGECDGKKLSSTTLRKQAEKQS